MAAIAPEEGVLESIWRILANRKWVVLQALILVPAAVLAFSLTQDKRYTATASLLFRSSEALADTQAGFDDPDRAAATNQELVALPTIAERTARDLGGGLTPLAVRESIEIDSSGQSDLAEIQATTKDPKLSADMANAYGRAYINFRRQTDVKQIRNAINILQRNLNALSPEERTGPEGRRVAERLQALETAELLQAGNAELVQAAVPPTDPSSPRIPLNLALGILFGGALGFGLAALLERIDRRLKTVEDLERVYRLPVLARIPRSRRFDARSADGALEALKPGPESEAFRVLRANLRYYAVDRQISSILVVSPLPGDGKSTVARCLAMTMATMGDSVVLVDADLHRGMSGGLGEGRTHGLSSVLAGWDLDDALVEVSTSDEGGYEDSRRLWALPSGPLPPNPSELLESARMRSVIAGLEERFDIVVIDSPALSMVSDALPLVSQVSGVIIVNGLGHTTRDAANDLLKQLSLIEGRPLGIVANYAQLERSDGSYYGRPSPVGAR